MKQVSVEKNLYDVSNVMKATKQNGKYANVGDSFVTHTFSVNIHSTCMPKLKILLDEENLYNGYFSFLEDNNLIRKIYYETTDVSEFCESFVDELYEIVILVVSKLMEA